VRSMTVDFEPREFSREWIAAWNSHDLDAILSHYAEDIVLTSPVAARILNTKSGTVQGKSALREYFKLGLQAYPDLHFEFLDVMHGLSSLVICYINQKGTKTAEFMELREDGKVVRVVANYSA
jgi:predicted ester cyclase